MPLLPDVLPLPEGEGLVEGEVEGLVMLPVLPPVLARVSYAFFAVGAGKRCTSPARQWEEPLAEPLVPLDGLSLCA